MLVVVVVSLTATGPAERVIQDGTLWLFFLSTGNTLTNEGLRSGKITLVS